MKAFVLCLFTYLVFASQAFADCRFFEGEGESHAKYPNGELLTVGFYKMSGFSMFSMIGEPLSYDALGNPETWRHTFISTTRTDENGNASEMINYDLVTSTIPLPPREGEALRLRQTTEGELASDESTGIFRKLYGYTRAKVDVSIRLDGTTIAKIEAHGEICR